MPVGPTCCWKAGSMSEFAAVSGQAVQGRGHLWMLLMPTLGLLEVAFRLVGWRGWGYPGTWLMGSIPWMMAGEHSWLSHASPNTSLPFYCLQVLRKCPSCSFRCLATPLQDHCFSLSCHFFNPSLDTHLSQCPNILLGEHFNPEQEGIVG